MMTAHAISAATAGEYFEHSKDYYTKQQTCHDKWHGSLAESIGGNGELSKEQFDHLLKEMTANGSGDRAGFDLTFSAPKSVSLSMAKDAATQKDMIEAHQAAVAKMTQRLEMDFIQTRINGQRVFTRNMCASEFVHMTARPTAANDFVPDLDLHSHLVVFNMTYADGKMRAVDFKKILDKGNVKQLGLEYRQALAAELQSRGYELELTDGKQGFFEIKGYNRETIEKYSHREQEVKVYKEAHPEATEQEAKTLSRTAKDKAEADFEEVQRRTHEDLFRSGKIKIRKMEVMEHGREIEGNQGPGGRRDRECGLDDEKRSSDFARERSSAADHVRRAGQSDFADFGRNRGRGLEAFEEKRRLSELPHLNMDEKTAQSDMLLSARRVDRLGQLQSERIRNYYLQREAKAERLREIDNVADKAIKNLSREKYAFSVLEAKRRVMAEGVLQNISEREAEAALERANVVKLGRIETEKGKTRDVYMTTEENIKKEELIKERVQTGKGAIKAGNMKQDEARVELDHAEAKLNDGKFLNPEQRAAVEYILSSNDRYVGVNGLAGTGKTMMLERVRAICDEQGIKIRGACFTGKAASGLEADSGIQSQTIHSFLNEMDGRPLEKGAEIRQSWDFSRITPTAQRELWIVDEAGLVDNNLMNELQTAAEARNAQVILVGDPDQLPPVGCGEPMRLMEEKGMATAHLTAIRRQNDAELLQAVRESVQGDHLVTFEKLEAKGNYREISGLADRRDAIKKEMTAGKLETYKDRLLLTSTNAERKALNKGIRAEYVKRGELEAGKKFEIVNGDGKFETRNLAAKDRIIFLSNNKKIGVMNGDMGTIEKIDGQKITVRTDGGQKVEWDIKTYKAIDHSYAVTNYKAQGMTVQRVVCDMSTKGGAQTRNALYVDISRAKAEAVVFTDDKKKLERQTKNFARKITGKNFARKIEQMKREGGIRNNDRYHAPKHDTAAELDKALKSVRTHTVGKGIKLNLGGMDKGMGAGIDKGVAQAGRVAAKAVEAVATVAEIISVVGKFISATAKVAAKGVEVGAEVAGTTFKVAKEAAGMAKSVAETGIKKGLKAEKEKKELEQGFARVR